MSDVRITSYNQSGGITAQNVNIGAVGRHVDDGVRQKIRTMIPKNQRVVISGALGDGESCAFAEEIKQFMAADGYAVEGVNQSVWMPPVTGVAVVNGTTPWQVNVGHHPGR